MDNTNIYILYQDFITGDILSLGAERNKFWGLRDTSIISAVWLRIIILFRVKTFLTVSPWLELLIYWVCRNLRLSFTEIPGEATAPLVNTLRSRGYGFPTVWPAVIIK